MVSTNCFEGDRDLKRTRQRPRFPGPRPRPRDWLVLRPPSLRPMLASQNGPLKVHAWSDFSFFE